MVNIKHYKHIAVYLILAISICNISICSILEAKTDALFSPNGKIKDSIIENINSSVNSIDVAAFVFTQGDIAKALFQARERGVKIRLVINKKQNAKEDTPTLEFIKEEGLDLRFLKGNVGGVMHNTFAIFDSATIITGSYNWTEYSEKFNYENAIITDEPEVVKKFKENFNLLYDKSGTKLKVQGSEQKNNSYNVIKESIEPEKAEDKTNGITINNENNIKNILNISFDKLDKMIGSTSKLEKKEKKKIWNDSFAGKIVKWSGKVIYKGASLYDWNKIGISHTADDNSANVQLKFDYTKLEKVKQLNIGDVITYTGKLDTMGRKNSPYKLVDANILHIMN